MKEYNMHTEKIKELYNSSPRAWPKQDRWHRHTKRNIEDKIYEWLVTSPETSILNAGSGGTVYDIEGNITHFDIAENLIKDLPNYVVGSIEDMPFPDQNFDVVICVGSVLNYVQLFPTLNELYRVIKPGGRLILEFERSNSAELWFKKEYGKNCIYRIYQYNGQEHGLWLYSEKFVKQTLETMGLILKRHYRFHNISSILSKFNFHMDTIINSTSLDNITQMLSYFSAHNCIFLFSKPI